MCVWIGCVCVCVDRVCVCVGGMYVDRVCVCVCVYVFVRCVHLSAGAHREQMLDPQS